MRREICVFFFFDIRFGGCIYLRCALPPPTTLECDSVDEVGKKRHLAATRVRVCKELFSDYDQLGSV